MTLIDDISDTDVDEPTVVPAANEVHLIGKLSKPLECKELPSGDRLGKWNLVVARPKTVPDDSLEAAATGEAAANDTARVRRRQSHDTLECISFDPELIERMQDVASGSRVEVLGALRRRFQKGQQGQSRYEVEAFTVAVLSTPTPAENAPAAESADAADPDHSGREEEPVTEGE